MKSNDPPDFNLDQQVWHDLRKRTWVGISLLPPLWLIIGFWVGIHLTHPVFFITNAFIIFVSSLLRLYWIFFLKSRNYQSNIKTLSYMILFSGFHWGVLFTWLLFAIDLSVSQHYTLVVTLTGLIIIASSTFNIFNYLGTVYPAVSITPPIIGATLYKIDHYEFYVFLTALLLVFSYINSKAAKKAYLLSLTMRETLTKDAQSALKLSRTDYLTKLGNRFHFMDNYEHIWQNSLDTQLPISLIMANVDFLKEINSEFGHQAGDQLIQQISKGLASAIEAPNVLARYGGDEFAIALPRTDFEQASDIANTIQTSIRAIEFKLDGQDIPCSCSLSVVSITAGMDDDPAAFLEGARHSLHKAKLQTSASWSTFKALRVFDPHKH